MAMGQRSYLFDSRATTPQFIDLSLTAANHFWPGVPINWTTSSSMVTANNAGMVAGTISAYDTSANPLGTRYFFWKQGQIHDLDAEVLAAGYTGFSQISVTAISDNGYMAGIANGSTLFLMSPVTPPSTNVPTLPVISVQVNGAPQAATTLVAATGPLNITWQITTDPQFPVSQQVGCQAVAITSDASRQLISCVAVNAAGSVTRTLTVTLDATPPVFVPITIAPIEAQGPDGTVWNYTVPTVTDNFGSASVNCAPAPGFLFPITPP
jgi:hypothetical protein